MKHISFARIARFSLDVFFLLLFLSLLSGCQASPFFDHDGAPEELQVAGLASDAQECSLLFSKAGFCGELSWISYPTEEQMGVMRLKFRSAVDRAKAGPYADPPAVPHVHLWMPEHGHGSSPIRVQPYINEQGARVEGHYRVSQVFFVMPGVWDFHVTLRVEGKTIDEAKMRYVVK